METLSDAASSRSNLRASQILDIQHPEIIAVARLLREGDADDHSFLRKAHLYLVEKVTPIYTVDEWQPASRTLQKKRGSCSQRMACLEAISRSSNIPTRVRALHVQGSFWFPRFRATRWFIPERILLLWPQFLIGHTWLDFDELHATVEELASTTDRAFTNDSESIFDAVRHLPIDFGGKTCGLSCAQPGQDLSRFVISDDGFFDNRDEALLRFGSFQHTFRGGAFQVVFGNRKSC